MTEVCTEQVVSSSPASPWLSEAGMFSILVLFQVRCSVRTVWTQGAFIFLFDLLVFFIYVAFQSVVSAVNPLAQFAKRRFLFLHVYFVIGCSVDLRSVLLMLRWTRSCKRRRAFEVEKSVGGESPWLVRFGGCRCGFVLELRVMWL